MRAIPIWMLVTFLLLTACKTNISSTVSKRLIMSQAVKCETASTPQARIDACTPLADDKRYFVADKVIILELNTRAGSYLALGNFATAEADLKRAIKLSPADYMSHHNLGELGSMRQDWAAALKEYDLAVKNLPDRKEPNVAKKVARVFVSRGRVHERLGDLDAAIADAKSALSYDPWNATAHNNMGYLYLRKGDYAKSISYYQRALELNPTDRKARAGLTEAKSLARN